MNTPHSQPSPPQGGERAFSSVIASVAKQPRGLTRNDVAAGHVQTVRKGLGPRLRGENGRQETGPLSPRQRGLQSRIVGLVDLDLVDDAGAHVGEQGWGGDVDGTFADGLA